MFVRKKKSRTGKIVHQLVETARVNGKVRQMVIAHLGEFTCQRRSDDRMKRAGLKTGCERAFIFFKSFSQNSSSFVLFFVLFGGARGLDFLRSCTIQATESAAHFESADEFPIKV